MATMIKFRAWDKIQNKMLLPDNIEFINGQAYWAEASTDGNGSYSNDGKADGIGALFELEQFTDLKDMNGKDIYEGDILRLSRNEPKTYIYDEKDNLKSKIIMPKTVTETAPVTNDAGTFGVSVKGVFLTLREVDKGQQNIEVIGNIHTNHELLEEDK
ncbi:prophage Lp2 protein 26 [Lactiplantibacillus plantarum]|nr:prophage Lp2 protein 26 [Lactiplantibacillus plantarum]MCG0744224.1 prophage Lp2 protein 26 [Lactiplantibacillus plantarum]